MQTSRSRKPAPEVGDPVGVKKNSPLGDPSVQKQKPERKDPEQDDLERKAPRRPPDNGRDGNRPEEN